MNARFVLALALSLTFGTALPGSAQQAAPPTPAQTREPDPDPAMLKAMKSRVFEVKHRNAFGLAGGLRLLGSGVRGARIDVTDRDGLNLITVRDFPENLAAIEDALKRLDAPSAATQAPDVELKIQVLVASREPVPERELPMELQKVVGALKGTLAYRGFTPVASFVQRTKAIRQDRNTLEGTGIADPKALGPDPARAQSELELSWWAKGLALQAGPGGALTCQLDVFRFVARERGPKGLQTLATFETGLSLKEGETVVVGTSVVKDRGLIVVVSVRRAD